MHVDCAVMLIYRPVLKVEFIGDLDGGMCEYISTLPYVISTFWKVSARPGQPLVLMTTMEITFKLVYSNLF